MDYKDIFDKTFWIQVLGMISVISFSTITFIGMIKEVWIAFVGMSGLIVVCSCFFYWDFGLYFNQESHDIAIINIPICLWKGLKKFFGY